MKPRSPRSTTDREGFDCGEPKLNTYLQRYTRQNHARGGARCFGALPIEDAPLWLLLPLATIEKAVVALNRV